MNWPWNVLELPGPSELPEIRRAYAQKLKAVHPEEDPEGFQQLHDAYQQACRIARQKKRGPAPQILEVFKPPPLEKADRDKFPRDGEKKKSQPEEAEDGEDWDYDELLRGDEKKRSQPEEESDKEEDGDWDYDELLRGDEKKQSQPEEESDEEEDGDWDYDELLRGDEKKRSQPEEESDKEEDGDWDYDELLRGDEKKRSRPEGARPEKDWDYERLFAEGEEEARAAQRRKIEELRKKNRARIAAQEKEQRRRAEDDEEAWAAVMAATHALELLLSCNAPLPQWRSFLQSPVFWNVKANLDFIFALEDFLEQNPDLPLAVRRAVFEAYGFANSVPPECRRLSRLLHVSRKERRKLRWKNSRFRKEWKSWPVKRRFASVFGVVFLLVMSGLALMDLLFGPEGAFRRTPWQETMCARLEEDYHRTFVHPYEDGEFIFAPEDDPDLLFFAYEDDDGGYQTNYPERMVMEQMKLFAEKHGLPLELDSAGEQGYQGQLGETPGAYYLQMPLTGKSDAIQELGELLEAMKGKQWYWPRTPDFEVFLAYGDLHFYQFRSTEGDFDADYAQVLYETKFGPELCRYIAEESGIAADILGEDNYVLLERGTITVDGVSLFWCSGMSRPPDSTPLNHFLLSADGKQLFSVSNETFAAGVHLSQLYQGVRWIRIVPGLGDHASVAVYHTP